MFGSKQGKLFSGKKNPPPKKKPMNATIPGAKSIPMAKGNSMTKKGIPKNTIIIGAVVVIIIIAAYLLVFSSPSTGAVSLGSNKTMQLAMNKSVLLQLSSSPSPFALQMVGNKSGGFYTFYFSKTPILTNPIYSFSISTGQVVNLSSTGGSAADLQIKLVSVTGGVATVELIPVPAAFGVKVSPVTVLNPVTNQPASTTTVASTTTIAPTTTALGSQSSTTTVPVTTVTVGPSAGGSYTDADVMLAANASQNGTLMSNYKALYIKDQACTSSEYNTSFIKKEGYAPSTLQETDWANVSAVTPYDLTFNITYISGAEYEVVYSVQTHSSLTSGPVLDMKLNAQSGTILSASYEGVFIGQSYDDVLSGYQTANNTAGNCGVFLP